MSTVATKTETDNPAPPGDSPKASTPVPARRGLVGRLGTTGLVLIGTLVVWLILRFALGGMYTEEIARSDLTPLHRTFNAMNEWVSANRDSSPIFVYFLNYVQLAVEGLGNLTTSIFARTDVGLELPIIGWLGTTVLLPVIAYAVGNVRVAILTLVGLLFIVSQGLWVETMDTFVLVLAAVLLALVVGLPIGIWAGVNDRVNKIVTPVLDFMQILPSFAYLSPLVLIFTIGPAPAIIATWIFAVPPVIRLAAHGIRQVPATTREAVDSLGVTGSQRLRTVLVPMAKRTIVIGVSQTIMAALSMVTIAALIGAPGIGLVVTQALQKLDVGAAFNGGLAIVLLAIIFDRVTTAASVRSEVAARTGQTKRLRRRIFVGAGLVLSAVAIFLAQRMPWAALPPTLGSEPDLPGQITNWPDLGSWVVGIGNGLSQLAQDNLGGLTRAISNAISYGFLNPFQSLLTGSPWFVVGAVFVVLGALAGGWRIATLAVVCVGLLYGLGLWNDTMYTLASTTVATIITMIFGIVVGVWMGRSKRVDTVIRPLLDAAQTMPAFVYLVPFLALFGPTRFTAIIAAVVFAAPAAIKIVADGIAQVSPTTIEAATSTGSTTWQMISKVQVPMSAKAIGIAANQGLIYCLSMVVVGALVGAGALGYEVVTGLNQLEIFGKGLAAALSLVVLGILLDRITQAAADRSRQRSVVIPVKPKPSAAKPAPNAVAVPSA